MFIRDNIFAYSTAFFISSVNQCSIHPEYALVLFGEVRAGGKIAEIYALYEQTGDVRDGLETFKSVGIPDFHSTISGRRHNEGIVTIIRNTIHSVFVTV